MHFTKKLFIASMLLSLSACSYIYSDNGIISNRETTYLKSKSVPPLQIPPGLSSSTIHEEYPIPDRNYPESAKKVSLVPPELYRNGN
jgi:uncharacterized lipoprotein